MNSFYKEKKLEKIMHLYGKKKLKYFSKYQMDIFIPKKIKIRSILKSLIYNNIHFFLSPHPIIPVLFLIFKNYLFYFINILSLNSYFNNFFYF